MKPIEFRCLLDGKTVALPHVWERIVGSGHATLALRADYQTQLRRAASELGFQYVRFHGLLSDDVGTLVQQGSDRIYSFFNAHRIWDAVLDAGMRPFVELSFMPTAIASGHSTVFHYRGNVTPPRDWNDWSELVRRLAASAVARYGPHEVEQWFFEVWNEPNLRSFWRGTRAQYFQLYREAARALKELSPELRVGGPAIDKSILWPLGLMFLAFTLLFITTHLVALKNEVRARKIRAEKLKTMGAR